MNILLEDCIRNRIWKLVCYVMFSMEHRTLLHFRQCKTTSAYESRAGFTPITKNDFRKQRICSLREHAFHCRIFPHDRQAALSYARAHPASRFLVKLPQDNDVGLLIDDERFVFSVRSSHCVQNCLDNRLLIDGHKWDIHVYVLISSVLPLRAYVYTRHKRISAIFIEAREFQCEG